MPDQLFHVVCRNCPTESLRSSADSAAAIADGHAARADHEVAVGRVE
ncbi:hypothetical protein Hbl1158_11165 [Halobaculum sp. CBA1158]|nr:hypothetical protein [Halobaculum sp. CBA1158]UIO99089.1 hypothetical protein Hbl1158_11165 [Halobaculum sp. CBA1158]